MKTIIMKKHSHRWEKRPLGEKYCKICRKIRYSPAEERILLKYYAEKSGQWTGD